MEIILPFEHPLVIFISYLMSKIARGYPNVSKYDSKEIAIDYFFSLSNFAIIEETASGKLLIQDGKEISLLKSGAVKKKKKQSRALDTQDNFSVQ